jgi:enamine deaminase RidA (YjgF/YER057c/UK114 family)
MDRYLVNPPELKDAQAVGYNHAVIANGEFYAAGQVAMDAGGGIVGDDVATQARKAYENVGILLEAVGKDVSDVAKVTTHIVEPHERYFDGYKDVYWETFDEPYPCHTVLGAYQLAHEEYLLEIEIEVPFSAADVDALEVGSGTVVRVT